MDTRRFYGAKRAEKLVIDIPTAEEESEDDEESPSDSEIVDSSPAVPADIGSASGQDSGSESDTLYRLATDYDSDESDTRSEDDDQLAQFTDQSSIQSSDADIATESDAEESVWKKHRRHTVNVNFDSIQIMPAFPIDGQEQPVDFFRRFVDDDIIQLLVCQTNLYAKQMKLKHWNDTDESEIKSFVGMLIAMGLHDLPRTELYWSSARLFRVTPIAHIMPVKRFKKIRQAIHVNDNSTAPKRGDPNYDKLYKLRPLIDGINERFQSQCIQTTSQSVDEGMIAFKGRSSLKQYMPLKPIKRGYKV